MEVKNSFQEAEGKPVVKKVEHYKKQWNDRPKLHGKSFYYRDSPPFRVLIKPARIFLVF